MLDASNQNYEVLDLKKQNEALTLLLGQATERLQDVKALLAVALEFANDTEDDDAPLFLKAVLVNALRVVDGNEEEEE